MRVVVSSVLITVTCSEHLFLLGESLESHKAMRNLKNLSKYHGADLITEYISTVGAAAVSMERPLSVSDTVTAIPTFDFRSAAVTLPPPGERHAALQAGRRRPLCGDGIISRSCSVSAGCVDRRRTQRDRRPPLCCPRACCTERWSV